MVAAGPACILALSASSRAGLEGRARRVARDLAAGSGQPLAERCLALSRERPGLPHRLAVVASSAEQIGQRLTAFAERAPDAEVAVGQAPERGRPRVAFLFTGQGAQHAGMGRGLYAAEPVFRDALDRCSALLEPVPRPPAHVGPVPGAGGGVAARRDRVRPAGAVRARARPDELWRSWGIEPDVVLGHSVGEYAAAGAAGVFGWADGLRLVAQRAA